MSSWLLIILEVIQTLLQIVYLMFPNGFFFQIPILSPLVSFSMTAINSELVGDTKSK